MRPTTRSRPCSWPRARSGAPESAAVARITTIGVQCWGSFPVNVVYNECQVTVEGNVFPIEAFDPGSAEP